METNSPGIDDGRTSKAYGPGLNGIIVTIMILFCQVKSFMTEDILKLFEFIFNKMKKKLKIHKQKAVREQPLLHRKYVVGKIMKVDILHVLFLGIHSIYNYILYMSIFLGT